MKFETINTQKFSLDETEMRWVNVIRGKADQYEHQVRKKGEEVSEPSLDAIANEIVAFFAGLRNRL